MNSDRNFRRLCKLYHAYLLCNALPPMSAEELIHEDITALQRMWLSRFCFAWEKYVL